MQSLIKLHQASSKFYLAILSLVMLSQAVLASETKEIKVYLHKEHAEQIIGLTEAKAYGHTVDFIFLDRLDEIQNQISDRVTQEYQSATDAVIAEVGMDALMSMSDIERTEFFMKQFEKMKVKPITPATVFTSEIDDVKHAVTDVSKAEEQGITADMLPAVEIKGRLYQRQYDLLPPIKENQQ